MLDKGIIYVKIGNFSSAKRFRVLNPLSYRFGTYHITGLLKESKISPLTRKIFFVADVDLFIVR